MKQSPFAPPPAMCTPEAVIDFLDANPDFFIHHESALKNLELPHRQGETVSLVAHQQKVLREENRQLHRRLAQLIETAKDNENLNQRIQRLILLLLDAAPDTERLFAVLYQTLKEQFHTEFVVARLFGVAPNRTGAQPEFVEYDAEVHSLFENVLGANKPICGRLSEAQAEYLFPGEKIGSAMLIPLSLPDPSGLLALASGEVSRYYSGMGTDLMAYLGSILGHFLRNALD